MFLKNRKISFFSIILLILITWIVQILYLNQVAKAGMNGWDDWQLLYYYDAERGSNPLQWFAIIQGLGTPYLWTQALYMGLLKDIVGLNLTAFKLVELLWKALAALSVAFLVFKFTKDKLFAILTVFFFLIFPSTAGVLQHNVLSGGYLTIVFMCFFIYFYFQSTKKPYKILLASLFFFLGLLACPPRAYLFLPVPLFVELYRLKNNFRLFIFIRRLFIFYFSLIFLQSNPGWFDPGREVIVRWRELIWGNFYLFSLPLQMVSSLFVDQRTFIKFFQNWNLLIGFIPFNFLLILCTLAIGLIIYGKKKCGTFVIKVLLFTIALEIIFYALGTLSLQNGMIYFKSLEGNNEWAEGLNPSLFQAALGGYLLILSCFLTIEWRRNQRENSLLKITLCGLWWAILSEFLLFLTNGWFSMVMNSFDKYILACALGAVIFTAGIFTLVINGIRKIKNYLVKTSLILLTASLLIPITIEYYNIMNNSYYDYNENQGASSYWQDNMYKRFLDKVGRDKLNKDVLVYADYGHELFNDGSFKFQIRYRIYYDEQGNFMRGTCKTVVEDIKLLKSYYTSYQGKKGFIIDMGCLDADIGHAGKRVFFPLSSFFAFKVSNHEFYDIKADIINKIEDNIQLQ